jgi:perosamine synthetase
VEEGQEAVPASVLVAASGDGRVTGALNLDGAGGEDATSRRHWVMRIPITKPFFGDEERRAILKPLETGWVVQGPFVKEFEAKVAAFTGAGYARATSSCTTALHLSLIACGVKPGDEVVLPSFTFVASANAIRYVGAKPVFADIQLSTFSIDEACVDRALSERTSAVLPVHLFGLCADMDPLLALAKRRGLAVVEDAACAIGGFYKGAHAGTLGQAGCLSFHPRKSITTGEGGMVLTSSSEVARKIEIMRDHGADATDLQRHAEGVSLLPEYNVLGFNYRMTDFQGAIGVAQMGKLEAILSRRSELAGRYTDGLRDLPWLRTPAEPEGYRHGYQAYVCMFAPADLGSGVDEKSLGDMSRERIRLMDYLEKKGISVRQGTHAVHTLGLYRDAVGGDPWACPNSLIADRLSLALPLFPQMDRSEQDYVMEALHAWK